MQTIKFYKKNTPEKLDSAKYGLTSSYFLSEYKKASMIQIDISKLTNFSTKALNLADLRKEFQTKQIDDMIMNIFNSISLSSPIVIKFPDGTHLFCTEYMTLCLCKVLKIKPSVALMNLPKNYKELNLKA